MLIRNLGQNTPAPASNVSMFDDPSSLDSPYQTGAGYVLGIAMSIIWIFGTRYGIKYLRKIKAGARRAKKRRSR
jgi:hypothetical protein